MNKLVVTTEKLQFAPTNKYLQEMENLALELPSKVSLLQMRVLALRNSSRYREADWPRSGEVVKTICICIRGGTRNPEEKIIGESYPSIKNYPSSGECNFLS